MIQYSADHIDRYVAPGVGSFRSADIPDLRTAFPNQTKWLNRNFLGAIAVDRTDAHRRGAINFLHRAEASFRFYERARVATLRFVEESGDDSPHLGAYFFAVSLWDAVFLNVSITIEVWNDYTEPFDKQRVFRRGDGSVEECVYEMANQIKHCSSSLTLPLWILQDGFHTVGGQLAYESLASLLHSVGGIADELATVPSSA